MRGQFSPNEWKLLLDAPRWVYVALIGAERGSVSTRRTEAKALEKFLSGYKTRSPLVKEIIAGQEEADDKIEGSSKEAEKILGQVGTLLDRKADGDEGDAVRDLLMQAGDAVAEATREALIGDAESAKEEKALARIETALKATDADKRRRREAAAAAEAERRAQQAREAKARAAAEREREKAARAEAEKKAKEAEAKRKAAEAERKAAEAEAKRKAAEAEAQRRAEMAEAKKKAAEAEAQRRIEMAEAKKRAQEAEAQRRAEEAAAQKKAAEAEAQKAAEAAAAKAEATRIYVVKRGDTLSGIAKEVYGKAGRWPEIFEANRDIIKKANLIRPGWKLRIPD